MKKQVQEGIESIISRKGLLRLEGEKAGEEIEWQDSRPLIVDAKYILITKKDGTSAINPLAEHLKWLLLVGHIS